MIRMQEIETADDEQKPTVFIVDDDMALCLALGHLIESIGLTVRTYTSATEFLSSFDRTAAGCIVADIRLPGMSGLNLQETLTSQGIDIPVIAMSGFADVPMAVTALQHGAVNFLTKPFREQVLLDVIHSALEVDERRRRERTQREILSSRLARLTVRERQVLEAIVSGVPNKEVARRIGLSVKSIEANRARIMRKMEARSFADLIRMTIGIENVLAADSSGAHANRPVATQREPESGLRLAVGQATISATSSR